MLYRRYAIPSVWEEMDRIERQMNRAFRGFGRRWMGTPVYPALNVNRSGTRKEELLLKPEILQKVWILRKLLYGMDES